jgi:hypothetical protein
MKLNLNKTNKSRFTSIFKLCSASALSLFITNHSLAQTVVNFTYIGAIQTWTVPAGVTSLTIQAIGAKGGNISSSTPGNGASMKGTFTVTPGQVLSLLAGQCPGVTTLYPSGGGGSFVGLGASYATATPMIVAGGGGGANGSATGVSAPITTSGTGPTPGTSGNGAPSAACGSGGGGYFSNGGNDLNYGFIGGRGFQQGGAGGTASITYASSYQVGGFGGGGAANYVGSCNYRGGSGGGYSGGSAQGTSFIDIGEAGGSFNGGTNQLNTVGLGTGNGTITITYASCITPTITVNSGIICSGSSFTISASGASTYTYSGGSAIVTPTSNTSYTITGGVPGCPSATNIAVSSITVNAVPTVTVNSGSVCSGQSFTLFPTGAATYSYSGGSAVVSPTANTTYSVTGTNTLGCSVVAISSVTVNASPTISVTSGSICSGSSFTMVPTGAITYTYSSGSAVVTPTSNTSYSVTGSNTLGCVSINTAVSSITVNPSPVILASASNSIICVGESAILTASTSATSYTWNTGATTATISVSPTVTSTYTVSSIGTNGCVGNGNITVTVNACTGINEAVANLISVYPNPSNGVLNVSLTASLARNSVIEIYDALGKLVVKQILANELNSINISNLENGIYIFKVINTNNILKTGKLVKQ